MFLGKVPYGLADNLGEQRLGTSWIYDYIATRYWIQHILVQHWFSFNEYNRDTRLHSRRLDTPVLISALGVIWCWKLETVQYIPFNMTSFANKMQIFLWQITKRNHYCITSKKKNYFTFQKLNAHISTYEFGYYNDKYKLLPVTEQNFTSNDNSLKQHSN